MSDDALALWGCEATETSLVIDPGLPFEEWETLIRYLQALREAKERELQTVMWWIGDAIRYGERAYGERYTQAIDDFGLSYQRLANIVWVAGKFPVSRRREKLPFAHHAKVAALPPGDADALLDEAERENLTSRELWDRRVEMEAERNGRDVEMERAVRAVRAAREALERIPPGRRASIVWFELVSPLRLQFDREGE